MPAPSSSAKRLAEDLVHVGRSYGFEAVRERPVLEGSRFCVDVFWTMKMPQGSPFPDVNVASFEIQYSDSPSSISHGILKAEKNLHPSYHFVISFSKLSDDFIEVLKANYPQKGLVIKHGEDQIKELNFWISRFKTLQNERHRLSEEGRRIREYALSRLQNLDQFGIESRIRDNFGPEIEEIFTSTDAINKHAIILYDDFNTCSGRFFDLKKRWTDYANQTVLPEPSRTGIFDTVENLLGLFEQKIKTFFPFVCQNAKATFFRPIRSFEDIIELSDNLQEIHKVLAVLERSYLQRIEGHGVPPEYERLRDSATSELKSSKLTYDAVDALCESYWNCIFDDSQNFPWIGLPVFGEDLEFRRWSNFVLIPDYVRASFTRTWIFLSHEIAHQAMDRLLGDRTFCRTYQDLTSIFSQVRSATMYSTPEHLATEAIADILATLIGGEQYVLALTDLKYYPSFTLFSRQGFVGRIVQYPLILRTFVCLLAIRLAWGFDDMITTPSGKVAEDQILYRILNNIRKEDLLALQAIQSFLGKADDELDRLTGRMYSANRVRTMLNELSRHLIELENLTAPQLIERVLKENIVARLKKFIKRDFYLTKPSVCSYEANLTRFPQNRYFLDLASDSLVKADGAVQIRQQRKNRLKHLKTILKDLDQCRLAKGEPRDIIASLNSLIYETGKADQRWNQTAVYSILSWHRTHLLDSAQSRSR